MIRLNDLILLLVVFLSMLAGILFPEFCRPLQPYPQYFLMFLFLLSFLPIRLDEIWLLIRRSPAIIVVFAAFKVLILPVAIYWIFAALAPAYAASAFLLSAISTGVTAPFISNLVRGNSALVMVMVMVTSPLVPFTMPVLIKLLFARSVDISFTAMIRMLSLVIFVPIVTVEVLRRTAPRFISRLMKSSYPISLVLFALINFGVFSKYADFFLQEPSTIITAALVAMTLGAIYVVLGFLFFLKGPVEDRIAGAVSIGNMNNVLVIVFASHFFGPLEPTVAALYILPYFILIIPVRFYESRIRKLSASTEAPFRDKHRNTRSDP